MQTLFAVKYISPAYSQALPSNQTASPAPLYAPLCGNPEPPLRGGWWLSSDFESQNRVLPTPSCCNLGNYTASQPWAPHFKLG